MFLKEAEEYKKNQSLCAIEALISVSSARTLRGSLLSFTIQAKKKENTGQKDPNLCRTLRSLRQTPIFLQNTNDRVQNQLSRLQLCVPLGIPDIFRNSCLVYSNLELIDSTTSIALL